MSGFSPLPEVCKFWASPSQCPAKENGCLKGTLVSEAVMNSDGDTIDEKIEMEICDTHKTSQKNVEDATNINQSIQIKHPSAAKRH